jgi:murein DD-endopeptidase MepM/ murein hydrolase activator NlpD
MSLAKTFAWVVLIPALPLSSPTLAAMDAPAEEVNPGEPIQLELPFPCGERRTVSQAHGTFSHIGTDFWAWDFRADEGTLILAARDGVVRLTRSDSTRGGCGRSFGPDANYVIIDHPDGLQTQYLHFSRVFVHEGQAVKAGTVLGEVGHTGFSCGPHLHFQLQRKGDGWVGQSVPAVFRSIGDPEVNQDVVSRNCQPAAPPETSTVQATTRP